MFTPRGANLFTCLIFTAGCSLPSEAPVPESEANDAGSERGPRSAPGENGSDGETGPAGATGPQGETGPEGPRGAKGEPGAQGETGPEGPRGATGPTGPAGATGPQGPQGEQGPPGAAGVDGAPATTDGTRLKAVFYTSPDGLKAPSGQYWDAQLQTVCMVQFVGAGNYRCLPRPGVAAYGDEDCSVEVVAAYGWGIEGLAARVGTRNLTLGDEAVAPFYAKSGDSCVEYNSFAGLAGSGYQAPRYVVGERADSAFVKMAFTHE